MNYQYVPKVNVAKELAEISKDFTNPRELVRETIANSLDAVASKIIIRAFKDSSTGEEELVVQIMDDGVGMNQAQLERFFDLGYSDKRGKEGVIGHKGHGTKITYNSSLLTVFSKSIDDGQLLKAVVTEPRKTLNKAMKQNGDPPSVHINIEKSSGDPEFDKNVSGTLIELRGYDDNNLDAFAHEPLKDYIRWFTAWGTVQTAWGAKQRVSSELWVCGIGCTTLEAIPYGHPFPEEIYDFRALRAKDDRRPENYFVRRWISGEVPLKGHPDKHLRIVFSVEGDAAKREHNIMLRQLGRKGSNLFAYESQRYTVTERYGIYFCKDGIPVERKNDLFADRSEWTKWHAFVNSQDFSLTANRSSVENTPAELLTAIQETAIAYIGEFILGSDEYDDFARRMKLEEGRRKAEREKRDVARRFKEYKSKDRFLISGDGATMKFLEPGTEQGVVWLAAKLSQIWPKRFPLLNVLDLDSHFGYDLLIEQRHHLTEEPELAFVELKLALRDNEDFNHSFQHLAAIICWSTKLRPDDVITDIQGKTRVFKRAIPDDERSYTKYFLQDSIGGRSIEVLVLEKFLKETLNLERLP